HVPLFLSGSASHAALPSFPTRRSSDLEYPRLRCERFAHALAAAGDPPLELREATVLEQIVELLERADARHRDEPAAAVAAHLALDRKSTRLNSSHQIISYAVFCLKKKT